MTNFALQCMLPWWDLWYFFLAELMMILNKIVFWWIMLIKIIWYFWWVMLRKQFSPLSDAEWRHSGLLSPISHFQCGHRMVGGEIYQPIIIIIIIIIIISTIVIVIISSRAAVLYGWWMFLSCLFEPSCTKWDQLCRVAKTCRPCRPVGANFFKLMLIFGQSMQTTVPLCPVLISLISYTIAHWAISAVKLTIN